MANFSEHDFKFQILFEQPDGARVIRGLIGMETIELKISADDWKKLSASAGWFRDHGQL